MTDVELCAFYAAFNSDYFAVQRGDGVVEPSHLNLCALHFLFDDADFCVTVQVPSQTGNGDQLAAGPVFWAQDYNNYYTFDITPGGSAAIVRRLKGKWVYVLDYRPAEGIKTKPGEKNVLRVTTRGNSVTTYINDVKFASVKAQVPDGGGQIGLHAESEQAHRDTWKFIGLKVTDLPE